MQIPVRDVFRSSPSPSPKYSSCRTSCTTPAWKWIAYPCRGIRYVRFNIKLIILVFSLFHNFAFQESDYSMPPSHNWRKCLSAYECFFFHVTMFPMLSYEHDCNPVCHNNVTVIHSFMYRPGYHKLHCCCFTSMHEPLYL